MTDPETPQAAHAAFDALCDELEEYEPLPTRTAGRSAAVEVNASPMPASSAGPGAPEAEAQLDAEILAGLVSP